MTPRFIEALGRLLECEGAFSNHPVDRGGTTRWGISSRTYPQVTHAMFDFAAAMKIYYEDFWMPLRAEQLHNAGVRLKLFDIAVNTGDGVRRAVRYLQQALNALREERLVEDGVNGPATITATNSFKYPDALVAHMRAQQIRLYLDIVSRDQSQRVFLAGWLRRAQSL